MRSPVAADDAPPPRTRRASEPLAPEPPEPAGPRLAFDGYGCPADRLDDIERTRDLLGRMPGRLRMSTLAPPCVFRHPVPGRSAEGISGFVLMVGSRFTLHALPGVHFVHADVSSREPFDVEVVLAALKEAYAPRRVDWRLSESGPPTRKNADSSVGAGIPGHIPVTGAMGLEALR